MAFFGLLLLAAATGGASGVANCIQSGNIERHPLNALGTLGLVFFGAGFVSTVFIAASQASRIVQAVPYVICLIGAPLLFIEQAPNLLDPFMATLIALALTAVNHGCMIYEVRQDAKRRSA